VPSTPYQLRVESPDVGLQSEAGSFDEGRRAGTAACGEGSPESRRWAGASARVPFEDSASVRWFLSRLLPSGRGWIRIATPCSRSPLPSVAHMPWSRRVPRAGNLPRIDRLQKVRGVFSVDGRCGRCGWRGWCDWRRV